MSGLIPIADLPTRIEELEAIEGAHREDFDWIEEKLTKRLNTLVECEKQLVLYIYQIIRARFRRNSSDLNLVLIGTPDPEEEGPQSIIANTIGQLQQYIFSGEEDLCLVVPHLDVAVTTTQSGLSDRAREVVAMIYENPHTTILAFKDPSFELPKAITNVFAAKRQISGIPRDQLQSLITQAEARKFAVEEFNPFALYKYVSGLNVQRFREIMAHITDRLDFNPDRPEQADALYREIRNMTVLGDMQIPQVDLQKEIGGYQNVKDKIVTEILDLLTYKASLTDAREIREIEEIVPKGMLFVGPPGTGKTFFAKGMACALNATVSIVSGPELKSKWVGESLPYDEEVFVTIDGKAQRIQIGKLIENHSDRNIECWSYEENGVACFRPVTSFLEHEGPDYVDILVTETGREVRVTGGHSVFINRDGHLAEIVAEDVVPGETRIAVPLSIHSPGTTTEIDLFEIFYGRRDIKVSGYEKLLRQASDQHPGLQIFLDRKEPGEILVSNLLALKEKPEISLGAFQDCIEWAGLGRFRHKGLKVHSWLKGDEFSSLLPLDTEFGEFLGLWVSSGEFDKCGVSVRVRNSVSDRYLKLCKHLFGRVLPVENRDGGSCLQIPSLILQGIMREQFGTSGMLKEKRIPSIVWTATQPFIQAFLRGLLSDNLWWSSEGRLLIQDLKKGLAGDLVSLLQYVGIAASCSSYQGCKKDSYSVHFGWSGFLRILLNKVGVVDEEVQKRIQEYLKNLLEEENSLKPFVSNDILWDKVIKCNRVPYEGHHVYDISVQGTERFLAGFGNVLVHNSEGNLREVFSKARKAAPSIIIFDEIDSFATTRGTYSGSGVEHSMVNQLLTEMDGFRKEELVFVIGTTNFPESLDPALLRPGRFELQIEIPYPDDKDRKEILKIYREKFNLDLSGELLEFLVQKTGGFSDPKNGTRFSGDHLYAICRALKRESIRQVWKGKGHRAITEADCLQAIQRKTSGKSADLSSKEIEVTAIHEAGHAVLAYFCPNVAGIERISIATGSEDILGFVLRSVGENKYIRTKNELLDDICVCMGGRVAEAMFLDDVSVGCANDLQKATEIARVMVEELGMSQTAGLQVYTAPTGSTQGRVERRQMSASVREKLDTEITEILEKEHRRAQKMLEEYKSFILKLKEALLEKKTLYKEDIENIMKSGKDS